MFNSYHELTSALSKYMEALDKGELNDGTARQMSIMADKMVAVYRLKLQYDKSRGNVEKLEFLEGNK